MRIVEAYQVLSRMSVAKKAILTYLAKVEYPTQAKDLGVEGKVLLRFVVEKDGSISQIEKFEETICLPLQQFVI